MKHKYLCFILSAMMCNSIAVMPVMASQVTSEQTQEESSAAVTEDAVAVSEEATENKVADVSVEAAQEESTSEDASEADSFMDADERKALDDKASAQQQEVGYAPVEYAESSSSDAVTEEFSSDIDTETVDTEDLVDEAVDVDTVATSNASSMDIVDYLTLATQMEDAADGDTISTKMTYTPDGMYFDIDTLAGFTDYRGAFSIDVVDDSDTVLYTLGFPDGAWAEENALDLAAVVQTEENEPALQFNQTQELSFLMSVTLPSVQENKRYVLVDEAGNEYNLQTSDEAGKITFELSELRKYDIKDASGHEYDAMDTAASSGDNASSFMSRNRMVIFAVVISACMIIAACIIPTRRKGRR